jgi:hypothetical protein
MGRPAKARKSRARKNRGCMLCVYEKRKRIEKAKYREVRYRYGT